MKFRFVERDYGWQLGCAGRHVSKRIGVTIALGRRRFRSRLRPALRASRDHFALRAHLKTLLRKSLRAGGRRKEIRR